ncbi:MAG: hypothetical protein OHK0038_28140 [Flammeovirgaceae bacterium]
MKKYLIISVLLSVFSFFGVNAQEKIASRNWQMNAEESKEIAKTFKKAKTFEIDSKSLFENLHIRGGQI